MREARQVDRVPYMLIIGKNEIENKTVSVRDRETDKTESMTMQQFTDMLLDKIQKRA